VVRLLYLHEQSGREGWEVRMGVEKRGVLAARAEYDAYRFGGLAVNWAFV
jgi:hypothetical protein